MAASGHGLVTAPVQQPTYVVPPKGQSFQQPSYVVPPQTQSFQQPGYVIPPKGLSAHQSALYAAGPSFGPKGYQSFGPAGQNHFGSHGGHGGHDDHHGGYSGYGPVVVPGHSHNHHVPATKPAAKFHIRIGF
jgi:hypothetical protein